MNPARSSQSDNRTVSLSSPWQESWLISLADSDDHSNRPKLQVRTAEHKRWTHVGFSNLGEPPLELDEAKSFLYLVARALDTVDMAYQCEPAENAPARSHSVMETVRRVCERRFKGQYSFEDLNGKRGGAVCPIWLDMNDLNIEHTIYHVDPWPSTTTQSSHVETSAAVKSKEGREPVEIKVPRTSCFSNKAATLKSLRATVNRSLACLRNRKKNGPLDFTLAQMEDVESMACVWSSIRELHPTLVSDREWEKMETLVNQVGAWRE